MKVLILCNDFPPLNSIGARRPYSWYQHFKKFGIEPTVITKNWSGDISNRSDVLKKGAQVNNQIETNENGRIIRVPIKIILPEKLLIKYGEHGFTILRKMFTYTFKILSFISLFFDRNSGIYLRARTLLKEESFDAILITGEPFILFRYGYLLSKQFNIPWIPDFRDGWKLNHVTKHKKDILNRGLQWWEFQFEKKYLKSSAFIITTDALLADKLNKLHHKEAEVAYNGFDSFYNNTQLTVHQTAGITLSHVGTLTPGQRVEILLQAIKELNNEGKIKQGDITIKFTGIEYFPDQWKRIVNFDPGLKPYIITSLRISRERALMEMAESDFLISLTEVEYKTIFAKTYDYISVKRPILVIPDDESILSDFVRRLNAGYIVKDVQELKQFLVEKITENKNGKRPDKIELNTSEAIFYTRENQAKALATILKKKLKVS